MNTDATETKVQIRLSTRDPNLQIAEEPTILLVQTCMYRPSSQLSHIFGGNNTMKEIARETCSDYAVVLFTSTIVLCQIGQVLYCYL